MYYLSQRTSTTEICVSETSAVDTILIVHDATFSIEKAMPGSMEQQARLVVQVRIPLFRVKYMTRQRG